MKAQSSYTSTFIQHPRYPLTAFIEAFARSNQLIPRKMPKVRNTPPCLSTLTYQPSQVLLVATSHGKLGDTDQQTGAWLEEIAAPYYTWSRANVHVDIASPDGKPIPIDAASTSPPYFTSEAKLFHDDSDAMAKLQAPLSLNTVDTSGYDAIFIAGGHGIGTTIKVISSKGVVALIAAHCIVYDGPGHAGLKRALETLYKRGAVVSAVCHGPCGLVSAVKDDGTSILAGHKVPLLTSVPQATTALLVTHR